MENFQTTKNHKTWLEDADKKQMPFSLVDDFLFPE